MPCMCTPGNKEVEGREDVPGGQSSVGKVTESKKRNPVE